MEGKTSFMEGKTLMTASKPVTRWRKLIATLAFLFGLVTLFKSAGVLFGPQAARDAVGDFVPFVVSFNFIAGFFYVAASIGIWRRLGWAFGLGLTILVGTILTATAFGIHVFNGGCYEMQTVGALGIRACFWFVVVWILHRYKRAL